VIDSQAKAMATLLLAVDSKGLNGQSDSSDRFPQALNHP
jgi:hypothetical protein